MKKGKAQKLNDYYSKTIFLAIITLVTFLLLFSLIFSDNVGGKPYSTEKHNETNLSISTEITKSSSNSTTSMFAVSSTTIATSSHTTVPTTIASTPCDDELVRICDYIPDIIIELKYSTTDNFTGQKIYDFSEAYLRYGTVKKLVFVCDELRRDGYILKIWDAFRPYSAQCKLWDICPDPAYVSNPKTGNLSHCRGSAVDVTIVKIDGSEVHMPTDFDNFTALADRDYSDIDDSVAENVLLLENCMSENGFSCYFGEWWHYADTTTYQIDKRFQP